MAFYRKPSPLELTYIAQDTPTKSPFVNQYFTEGEGDLSLEELKNAVNKVAEVVPESHLVLKGHWGFRYWDDAGLPPCVRQEKSVDWNAASWLGLERYETPMDPRKGPLVEVILMEGSLRRIMFRTHHAVMDGAGTIFFIQQVFRVLRGESIVKPNKNTTEWDVVLKEGPVAKQVVTGLCRPVYANKEKGFEPGAIWKRYFYPKRPAGIGGKVMAVVASWADEVGVDKLIFRVPADLRRYLPKDQITVSNCTSMLDINPADVRSPQKLQQLIIAAMRNKQDIAWINPLNKWIPWVPMRMLRSNEKIMRSIHERGTYGFNCMTTNMGQFDFTVYSCPQFRCVGVFGVPIPLELVPLYISFFQTDAGTSFLVCMPCAIADDSDLDKVFDRIRVGLDAIDASAKR